MHFLMRASAVCVFPGGFGTLDEMFEALTLIQTGRMARVPFLLFGRAFWEGIINWQALADAGTAVIDAQGRTVTPGFIDAHSHISGNSRPVAGVDIAYIASKEEWLQRILEADDRMPPGEWITGGGWDHTLGDGEYPTRRMLDRVVPERPVFLSHIDGHYAWVNSKALALAGVTADTPVPAGGEIVLDEQTGEPMGILLEGAMNVVRRVIPDRSDAQRREGLAAMQRYANSVGITGLHQMGGLQDWLHVVEAGDPTIRVWYGERGPDLDVMQDSDAYDAGIERILALQQDTRQRVSGVGREAEVGPLLELGFVKLINDTCCPRTRPCCSRIMQTGRAGAATTSPHPRNSRRRSARSRPPDCPSPSIPSASRLIGRYAGS
jgi:hypothetical protein